MHEVKLTTSLDTDELRSEEEQRELDRRHLFLRERAQRRFRFLSRVYFFAIAVLVVFFSLGFISNLLADNFSYLALGRWYFNFTYSYEDFFRSVGPFFVLISVLACIYWMFGVRRWLQDALKYPLAYGLISALMMTAIWIALFSMITSGFIDNRKFHNMFSNNSRSQVLVEKRKQNVERYSLDQKYLQNNSNILTREDAFDDQQEIDKIGYVDVFVFLIDNALVVVSIDATEMLDFHVTKLRLNSENDLFVSVIWVFRILITFTVAPFYIVWARLLAYNIYYILLIATPKGLEKDEDVKAVISSLLSEGIFRSKENYK